MVFLLFAKIMQNPPKSNKPSNNNIPISNQSGNANAFADLMSPFSLPSSNQYLSQKSLNSLHAQAVKSNGIPSFTPQYAVNNSSKVSSNASSSGSVKNTAALNSVVSNPQRSTSPAPLFQPKYNTTGLDSLDPFARSAPSYTNTANQKNSKQPSNGSSLAGFTASLNTHLQSVSSGNVAYNQYQSNKSNASHVQTAPKGILYFSTYLFNNSVQSTQDAFDILSFEMEINSNASNVSSNVKSNLKPLLDATQTQVKPLSQIPLDSVSAWDQLDMLEKSHRPTLIPSLVSNTTSANDVFDLEYLQKNRTNILSSKQQDDGLLDIASDRNKTISETENLTDKEAKMARLLSMGFDEISSRKALINTKNDIGRAIALLVNSSFDKSQRALSDERKLEDMIHELMKMGFEYEPCKAALLSSKLDTQIAITMLLSESKVKEIKATGGKSDYEKGLEQLVEAGFKESDCRFALQSCDGDVNTAKEILLSQQYAEDNDTKKFRGSVSNRFDANAIVGAASQIGISFFKNAKAAFSTAKKKVGEVLSENNGASDQVSEKEWSKASFKDSLYTDSDSKSTKPYSPEGRLNRQISMDSIEIPLERKPTINNSSLGPNNNSKPSLVGNLLHLDSETKSNDFLQGAQANNSSVLNNISSTPIVSPPSIKATDEQIQKSSSHKMQGNEFFKQGQFGDAETEYTLGIECLPNGHQDLFPLYNNRAACRLKNGNNKGAVSDCDYILNIIAGDLKALLRRATAYEALENWEMARDDYKKIMNIDSSVKGCSMGLARVNAALKPKQKVENIQTLSDHAFIPKPQEPLSVKKAVDQAVQKVRQSNEAKEQFESEKFAASEAVEKKVC